MFAQAIALIGISCTAGERRIHLGQYEHRSDIAPITSSLETSQLLIQAHALIYAPCARKSVRLVDVVHGAVPVFPPFTLVSSPVTFGRAAGAIVVC